MQGTALHAKDGVVYRITSLSPKAFTPLEDHGTMIIETIKYIQIDIQGL